MKRGMNSRVNAISMITFLAATRYAQLLLSTQGFASAEVVICSQSFFYDLPSDPYLQQDDAVRVNEEIQEQERLIQKEIIHQRSFCYKNHIILDLFIAGCVYNKIHILKVFHKHLSFSFSLSFRLLEVIFCYFQIRFRVTS